MNDYSRIEHAPSGGVEPLGGLPVPFHEEHIGVEVDLRVEPQQLLDAAHALVGHFGIALQGELDATGLRSGSDPPGRLSFEGCVDALVLIEHRNGVI